MGSPEIAAVIAALGGLGGVTGIVGTILAYKRAKRADKNSSMVNNYQTLYTELRTDIGRIREEQREERKQWHDERNHMTKKLDALQEQLRKQDDLLHEKDIMVTALKGKVDTLTAQLEVYKTLNTPKKVTVNT